MIRFALALTVLLALSGCKSIASDLEALKDDPNSDCLTEASIWVTITLERNGGCHYPPQGFMLVPIAPAAK